MLREQPLITGETYHVFNRGVNKMPIFLDDHDHRRFQVLLYLANHGGPTHMGNILSKYKGRSFLELYSEDADQTLVDVLAYSLLPNHYHLVVQQKAPNGITLYLRKVATAYAMYFNARHERTGVLFQGRFKSSLIDNEPYYRWIFSYVHLNPVGLVSPDWETGHINKEKTRKFMREYPYSSYRDYYVGARPETRVLARSLAPDFIRQNDLEHMLENIKDRPL